MNDLDDLDSLLDASMAAHREEQAAKAARKRLLRPTTNEAERDALLASIAKYDETRIWETVGNVFFITKQVCKTCGGTEQITEGWMRKQTHRVVANTVRYTAGRGPDELPNSIVYHSKNPVVHCTACIQAHIAELEKERNHAHESKRVPGSTDSRWRSEDEEADLPGAGD